MSTDSVQDQKSTARGIDPSIARAAPLTVRLLGPVDVRVEGQPLPPLRSRREEWLLALLCLRSDAPLSREWLAATLWPDSDGAQALYNLRRALTDLRHALGPAARRLHAHDHRTIRLDLAGAEVDVLAFDAALRQGDAASLQQAVALYRGALLEGCNESWITVERARREEQYLQALERLADATIARRDFPGAIAALRCTLAADPTRETALRALLESLVAVGDTASAVVAYREFRLYLRAELNTQPSPETRRLYERLKDLSAAGNAGVVAAAPRTVPPGAPEPAGGAVPLDSPYYVEREADLRFHEALARADSIVLVKGPRQVGKTSLLARGLARARQAGCRVVVTDLQKLGKEQLASPGTLLLALARHLIERLDLDVEPASRWNPQNSPNENFERFLRRYALGESSLPLIWGIDEVDRLFGCYFSGEVFGLFRSWHNERALDPDGPWGRLTLAMAYATEAHLFITDLNQSPFNVGTRLTLEDFTEDEVARLNRVYGSPLPDTPALQRFLGLVGGHPYLVRRALQELSGADSRSADAGAALERLEAAAEDSPFGDHLRRMLLAIRPDPDLCRAVREVLAGRPCPGQDLFYRLRSAGVVAGAGPDAARMRCGLYARFLAERLP